MLSGLRGRITVILIGLAIGPLLLVGLLLTQRILNVQQTQALILEQEVARGIGASVSAFIEDRHSELRLVSQMWGLQNLAPGEQNQLLDRLMFQRNVYNELILVDGTGMAQAHVARYQVITDSEMGQLAQTDQFQIPMSSGETYYSPVQIDPDTAEPLMTIAVPLLNPRTGQTSYVLIANFRLRTIWEQIANIEVRGSETVYVVDMQQRVVAHRNPSIVLSDTHFAIPGSDGIHTGLTGEEVILATQAVEAGQQRFYVVAERPTSEALQLATETIAVVGTALLMTFVLTVGIGILAVSQIIRPIQNLVATAQAIRAGDLSRRAETRGDEIGTLADAFNSMTAQLQEMLVGLETRVQERTRDLETAADVSRQITTVLEIDRLLEQVVILTTRSFGLYAGLVFLLNEEGDTLTLAAGADIDRQLNDPDKVGQMLLNLPLSAEPSIVALAARSKQAVTVNDVTHSENYMALEVLPATRSELAIPMLLGDSLLGVFDIQSDAIDHFGPDEQRVLTTVAEQVAIAVRNAQLFMQTQAARQEAERANKVKSQFLATVSHELRTPLNAIINFTMFVALGKMGTVNTKQEDALKKVVASAQHLLNLINDVLDMSKIEAGSLALYVEDDVDLKGELDTLVSTATNLLGEKPVSLIIDVAEDLPLLTGDRQRIYQIMLNLVSNACKFTQEGSITISARQRNGEVVLCVKDTGPGIAPEEHAIVFETFRQTETGLRQGKGTGLGMPISKRLTEAHGGRIWLESEPGKGAAFYVALPIHPPHLKPTKVQQEV